MGEEEKDLKEDTTGEETAEGRPEMGDTEPTDDTDDEMEEKSGMPPTPDEEEGETETDEV